MEVCAKFEERRSQADRPDCNVLAEGARVIIERVDGYPENIMPPATASIGVDAQQT